MEVRFQRPVDDRPYPLGFYVMAAFASALVWICALLGQLPLR